MKIKLTDEDRAVAVEYSAKLNKNANQWRYYRWIYVLIFFFGLALLFGVERLSKRMHSVAKIPKELHDTISAVPSPELNATSIELLESQIEVNAAMLRAEFSLFLKALVVVFLGCEMFCYALSNWRKDRQDRLIAKLLSGIAVEEDIDDIENANKDAHAPADAGHGK